MAKKTHNEMSQEEREKEAQKYIESQPPVEFEEVKPLNAPGEHVPDAPAKKSGK